jgi:hypothetical protein
MENEAITPPEVPAGVNMQTLRQRKPGQRPHRLIHHKLKQQRGLDQSCEVFQC